MEDLKILEIKLLKKLKREEKLESKLRNIRDEINDLEDKIARIKGTPEELEDIREEAENFVKDKKKRSRPNYEENFNWEREERTEKRQKEMKLYKKTLKRKEILKNQNRKY